MTAATFLLMLAVSGQPASDFEVRTLAGAPTTGDVQSVAADGSLTVGEKAIPAGEWYSARRAGRPLPAWPRAPHAELTGGDRLAGTVVEADGDALRVRLALPGAPEQVVRFPLSSLRAVWLTTRPADDPDPAWLA